MQKLRRRDVCRHGSYSSADRAKLKASRTIDTGSANTLFGNTAINAKFDPKYIDKRESCDSEEHPESTPIIIGVDVTGSMGYLPKLIASLMQQCIGKAR